MLMKGYSIFPKASGLEPYPQMVSSHILDSRLWGLTLLERCNRRTLQPQLTRLASLGVNGKDTKVPLRCAFSFDGLPVNLKSKLLNLLRESDLEDIDQVTER